MARPPRKLIREWYAKLAATGFRDFEYGRDATHTLTFHNSSTDRRAVTTGQASGAADLAAALGELPNHARCSTMLHRLVLGMLNQGLTKSGIVDGLVNQRRARRGAVLHAIEQAHTAARELSRSGKLHEPEDED